MAGESRTSTMREPRILAEGEGGPSATAPGGSAVALVASAAVVLLALTGVAAFGFAPAMPDEPVRATLTTRDLESPAIGETARPAHDVYWREERVRRGDTIGELFARAGVDDPALNALVRTDPSARALYQLRPGQAVRVGTGADGQFVALKFAPAPTETLTIRRDGDALRAIRGAADAQSHVVLRMGVIDSSLFAAADAAGLPDAITLALADAFSGDIDFHHDLRRGDRFSVVYETLNVDGEPAGAGRLLAAEFVNKSQVYRAYRWTAPDGIEGYYNEEGRSARKTFLRSPMAFSRVTSGYTLARLHPILNTWRAHRGIDYGAPTGTPVRVTADGVVATAGREGGYGNVVIVRHGGNYSTLYGHLSRFAASVRPGARVHQGETIGYVGQTGWATGPHLHYEFRVANEPRNPQTIALAAAEPVPVAQRSAFVTAIDPARAQLGVARRAPPPTLASTR